MGARLSVTDGVARLLDPDLSETDHVLVVEELLGKIDHHVCCVLLLAGSSGAEEGTNSVDAGILTSYSTACLDL